MSRSASPRRHRRRPDQVHEGAHRRLHPRASCARPRAARSTTPGSTGPTSTRVVIGKAPDIFEGIMQPELFLADALGAAGKPMLRVHTAGSVGCSTASSPPTWSSGRFTSACSRSRGRSRPRATRSGASAAASAAAWARAAIFAPWVRAVHQPIGRAGVHRLAGRGEGPPQRGEEPVRAPSSPTSPSRRCRNR